MRLLVVTQVVDQNDLYLGFFHRWIEELAKHVESIVVICLKEGEHHLPENVKVYSLGKEQKKQSPLVYAIRFKKLAWNMRNEYDMVFVHMNHEYILIAGVLWKLLGKRVYLWRNHYSGSWLVDAAAALCTKVFCTSRFSYTAKYKNTVLMPVGVDIERFSTSSAGISRIPRSILFFARMAPSKRPEILIDALKILKKKEIPFRASFYGSPLPVYEEYYASLKKKVADFGLEHEVIFHLGVPNTQAAEVFRAHEIFVNCAQSGMFDKMLFEAAASGCLVVASSEDFKMLAGDEAYFTGTPESLVIQLERLLIEPKEAAIFLKRLKNSAEENSLSALVSSLVRELQS